MYYTRGNERYVKKYPIFITKITRGMDMECSMQVTINGSTSARVSPVLHWIYHLNE